MARTGILKILLSMVKACAKLTSPCHTPLDVFGILADSDSELKYKINLGTGKRQPLNQAYARSSTHRRSTTGPMFLHFHPFGDPNDTFMQLF